MLHDVFISYSRKDKAFASRLKKALEAYLPPQGLGIPRRRLDIFLDEQDFTGTEYHSALGRHLQESKKLVVVCSPSARASKFVNQEIEEFILLRGSHNVIPVLFEGIPNNEAVLGQEAGLAFPESLMAAMSIPLAANYRGFIPGKQKLSGGPFGDSWSFLLSNIYDISRSEIELRERTRRIRRRNIWIGAIGTIVTALSAISVWAFVERHNAKKQRDEALRSQSTFLAQKSREETAAGRPDLGLRLALAALPRHLEQPERPWVQAAGSALASAFIQQKFSRILGGNRAGYGHTLTTAKISPDGSRAILDYGTQVELWSLESGEQLGSFRSDDSSSYTKHVDFTLDGSFVTITYQTLSQLMFLGPDGRPTIRGSVVQIIDAATGKIAQTFQVRGHRESHVTVSPSGRLLFVATDERILVLEASNLEEEIFWLDLESDSDAYSPPYARVLFSETEDKIAIATTRGRFGIIDLERKRLDNFFDGSKGKILDFYLLDRGGEGVAIVLESGVELLNTSLLSNGRIANVGPARLLAASFSRKNSAITAIDQDARVYRWQRKSEKEPLREGSKPTFNGVLRRAYLNDTGTAAVIESEGGAVESWNLDSGARTSILPASGDVHLIGAGFDTSGASVLLASSDNTVRIWDPDLLGASGPRLEIPGQATAVAYRPGREQIAVGAKNGSIKLVSAASGQVRWQSSELHGGEVNHLAFDDSGSHLVSTSNDRQAIIWDIAGTRAPIRLIAHSQPVQFGAFSPDGTLVVTGSSDSSFRLWSADSGKEVSFLPVPDEFLDPIHNASRNAHAHFTSDGQTLVTVTAGDGHVIGQPALVWDVRSGKLTQALKHPLAAIWDIAITPNGQNAVTASYDNSAVLWDLRTGKSIRTFLGHTAVVVKAVVCDEGRLLATASIDGSLRIWAMDSGFLIHKLSTGTFLANLEASHDGRLLATGSNNEQGSEVVLWDVSDGTSLARFQIPGDQMMPFKGLQFSQDDRSLLALTASGTISVWSLPPVGQALVDAAWKRVGSPGTPLLTREQRIRFAIEPP